MNITNVCVSFAKCTDNKNDDIFINIKYSLISMPADILLAFLTGLMICTLLEQIIINKWRSFCTQLIQFAVKSPDHLSVENLIF